MILKSEKEMEYKRMTEREKRNREEEGKYVIRKGRGDKILKVKRARNCK